MAKEKQEKTAAETPAVASVVEIPAVTEVKVAEVVPDLEGEKKKVKGKKEKSHKKKAAKEKTIKASKKSKKAA
jgi:hypothetical protein